MKITPDQAMQRIEEGEAYTAHPQLLYQDTPIKFASLVLTFSQNGEDYISLEASLAEETELDPVTAPKLELKVGLAFVSTGDTADMLHLHLTAQSITKTNDAPPILYAQSYESVIRDAGADRPRAFTAADDLTSCIKSIIGGILPEEKVISHLPGKTQFLNGSDVFQWKPYANPWQVIQEICDNAEATLFHDGQNFHLVKLASQTGKTSYYIDHNITKYSIDASRSEFANHVITRYSDDVEAHAVQTSGEYATSAIGSKIYIDEINHEGSRAQAAARAQAILKRRLAQNLKITIEQATLPLLLRPGDTIQALLNKTLYKGLIDSVKFDITGGLTIFTFNNIERIK